MKLAWLSDWDSWGNGKGYTVHNNNMRAQAVRLGAELVTPMDCDIAIDVVVPVTYKTVPGKFNVLFTMYEMDRLPVDWIPPLAKADLIIVPCEHNKRLFQRYTDRPVVVCQEGFDPKEYPIVKRTHPEPGKYFNFLWVGASNPRKGYEYVCAAWELWIKTQPQDVLNKTRLIMKTTKSKDDESVKSMFNCIIDNRKLPFEELKNLYYASHAFLFPSLGEGWALTLNEAQATGMPCIYTPWSGPVDFMDRNNSYPLKFSMGSMKAMKIDALGKQQEVHVGKVAKPEVGHILRRMEQVYYDYDRAIKKGVRGAQHVHRNFTWDQAGERLMYILETEYAKWRKK